MCELDLIFQFDTVHAILDQIIQGGLVLETNISEIHASGMHRLRRMPLTPAQAVLQARKASATSSATGANALQTANAALQESGMLGYWGGASEIAARGSSAWETLQNLGSLYWGAPVTQTRQPLP